MTIRFQVDPDFYDHPKSIGMSDAATALWVRAGSYSAAKLTDGFIAEHVLATLTRVPEDAAAELTRRGLWRRIRGGYQFHQWDHRNLSRERVEDDRAADRDRKKRARRADRAQRSDIHDDVKEAVDNSPFRGERSSSRSTLQARAPNVRPESERNPNGIQQDSGGIPGASVSVSVSESVSGSGRPTDAPPRPRCSDHTDDQDPPPCGRCAEARKARSQWDADEARRQRDAPRCRQHRGQPAHNCALCRSEALAAKDAD